MEHFKKHFEKQFREVNFRVGVTSFGDKIWIRVASFGTLLLQNFRKRSRF